MERRSRNDGWKAARDPAGLAAFQQQAEMELIRVLLKTYVQKTISLIVTGLCLFVAAQAFAADPILPLSEVRKGMKGYGVTVFEGSVPERFDVEILGILENVAPEQSLILARVDHEIVRRSGVIAGMSGSPIYIDGKVIGALAYAWQFSKEPIAGITPIEQMLRIATIPAAGPAAGRAVSASEFLDLVVHRDPVKLEAAFIRMMPEPARAFVPGAVPIAIPLSLAQFDPATIERFAPMLETSGFLAVPSGTTGDGAAASRKKTPFAPGDAFAGVLVRGDFNIAATGTVTHVDGERVWGFGHPFLDMGEIEFPMASSEIVTVLPNLQRSFKFSNTGEILGTLTQDRGAGVMGFVGRNAALIPVDITVEANDGTKKFKFEVIRNQQLFPVLVAMAADSVIASTQRAAGERTLILDAEYALQGFAPIRLTDGWAGVAARQSIPTYLALVPQYLISNEFREAKLDRVSLRIRHHDALKTARLMEATVETPEDGKINPGDTIRIRTVLKPFRGEEVVEVLEAKVPDTQRPGPAYLFIGSGTAMNQLDFFLVPPDPHSLEQVVGVLGRLRASTDLALGIYASSEGTVRGGVLLPEVPPSVQAMLNADTSAGAQPPVKYRAPYHIVKPLDYIVDGALRVDLDIRPPI
ncbi:MAG: SpoIVB peptidase S55 domain-containing protein [Thermoanaerobaculia bacterium]